VDAGGNVWVVNNGSDNLMKLSSAGTLLGVYKAGPDPISIAIDRAGDRVANEHRQRRDQLTQPAR